MRQKSLLKFLFLSLALTVAGVSNAWADPTTFTMSDQGWSNGNEATSIVTTDLTISWNKGSNNNAPKYYAGGTAVRAYGGNSFTVAGNTANVTITQIVIGFGSSDGSNTITTDVVTYENGTWTGSANSVTFTIGGSSGNRRIASIAVTYSTVIAVTSVSLDESNINLVKGNTQQLTATIAPATATNKTVAWSSDNETVATVSSTGLVTAVAAGDAKITVTTADGEFTATCGVHVTDAVVSVTGVSLSKTSTSLYVGDNETLTATVTPNDATNLNVTWESSDEDIVTVDDGVLSAIAVGTATITVTTEDGNKSATCEVTVNAIPTYTITWSVNGNTDNTSSVQLGDAISFNDPDEELIPGNYIFMGWSETEVIKTNTEPNFVSSATATADKTYYAVLAQVASSTDASWTETSLASMTASDVFVFANGTYAMTNDNGTSAAPGKEDITVAAGKITSEVSDNIKWNVSGNATDGYVFFKNGSNSSLYCNTTASSSSNNNIRINSSTDTRRLWEFDNNGYLKTKDSYTTRYLSYYANGADFRSYINTENNPFVPTFYKYIAATIEYKNYRTTVPTTVDIVVNEACTDGDFYYATFSSEVPFVVSSDIEVSEINVENGKLLLSAYNTGDVVPANTGVLISSLGYGTLTVNMANTDGTSILGTYNMLRASGGNGISAEDMAAADEDCIFYRLTMHDNTKCGFWWGAAEGVAFDVAADKAYLAVPTAQAANITGFVFADESTGISAIDNGQLTIDNSVYNLRGQRVSQPTRGLYIKDGRKFVMK